MSRLALLVLAASITACAATSDQPELGSGEQAELAAPNALQIGDLYAGLALPPEWIAQSERWSLLPGDAGGLAYALTVPRLWATHRMPLGATCVVQGAGFKCSDRAMLYLCPTSVSLGRPVAIRDELGTQDWTGHLTAMPELSVRAEPTSARIDGDYGRQDSLGCGYDYSDVYHTSAE